ncbi:MAG: tetratricopeptide repeat protein [Planctomycetes bacterium]|jgi:tetratricopeptide (TPR) repeat protein|nr:tetratricopeptide repeat protein [Planctomycetota bacterium]
MRAAEELERAWHLLALARPAAAAEILTGLLGQHPDCAAAWQLLALAQDALGEPGPAVASAERAIALDPESVPAQLVLAGLLLRNDQPAAALARCRQTLELEPTTPEAHALQAEILIRLGRVDEGIAAIDVALTQAPEEPDHHEVRGRGLFLQGRLAACEAAVAAGLRADPSAPGLHLLRGEVALRRGDVATAAEAFRHVLGRHPEQERARRGLLAALRAQHRGYRVVSWMRQGLFGLALRVGPGRFLALAAVVLIAIAFAAGHHVYEVVRIVLVAALLLPAELANLALWSSPSARAVLTRGERWCAGVVGGSLVVSIACTAIAGLTQGQGWWQGAKAGAALALLLSFWHWALGDAAFARPPRRRLTVLLLLMVVLIVAVVLLRRSA